MNRWLRLYDSVVDDPKVQRLSDRLFRTWINILCIASRNDGVLPSISDIAFILRLSAAETEKRLGELISAGLLDRDGGAFVPHNWDSRQFKSDISTGRVKRFRERNSSLRETVSGTADETFQKRPMKRVKAVSGTVSETASETAPETEEVSIQVRNNQRVVDPLGRLEPVEVSAAGASLAIVAGVRR